MFRCRQHAYPLRGSEKRLATLHTRYLEYAGGRCLSRVFINNRFVLQLFPPQRYGAICEDAIHAPSERSKCGQKTLIMQWIPACNTSLKRFNRGSITLLNNFSSDHKEISKLAADKRETVYTPVTSLQTFAKSPSKREYGRLGAQLLKQTKP